MKTVKAWAVTQSGEISWWLLEPVRETKKDFDGAIIPSNCKIIRVEIRPIPKRGRRENL